MATQTISAITLTQLGDGTNRVRVQATVTDTDNDQLQLSYWFKRSTDSTYLQAVTSGPGVVSSTSGGAVLDFNWDLDASSIDTATTADFDFRITATKQPVPATGTLTAVAANASTGIANGDTVVIAGRTYEFTSDADVGVGRVGVYLNSATETAAAVKTALLAAINGDALAGVTAASGAGQVINLTSKDVGAAANVAITQSLSNSATLTPVGLANGADDVIVNANQTITGATTGALTPVDETLPAADKATGIPNTLYIRRVEQTGAHGKGSRPQDLMKGAALYGCIDDLRSGAYAKFNYDADSSVNADRRAVLISVAEYQRVTAGQSVAATLKSKQWLSNRAWRSLTKVFENPNSVYAIYEQTFVAGQGGQLVGTQTVIAYFMSAARYNAFVG